MREEFKLIALRETLTDILITGQTKESVFNNILEELSILGVNSLFLGYVDFNERSLTNKLESKMVELSSDCRQILIEEARGLAVNLSFSATEYINEVFPLDFATVSGAIRAYYHKKMFILHKDKNVLESNTYKRFLSPKGAKHVIVFAFPISSNIYYQWMWLSFIGHAHHGFSDQQAAMLEKLWYLHDFFHIFRRVMTSIRKHQLLTTTLTPDQWQLIKSITGPKKDGHFSRQDLTQLARDLNIFNENKIQYNELELIRCLTQNQPLISWFDERVIRPQGNHHFLNK